jgi:hypothetical protein
MSTTAKSISLQENTEKEIKKLYGVEYFEPGESLIVKAEDHDLYYYEVFIGKHKINVEFGDCVYYLSADKGAAHLDRGPVNVNSEHMATVIRGYMPEVKYSTIVTNTNLPYVNGCSTKQVFPPERLGDPTLQLLNIPPHSSEQSHHIHSTVRVAYILSGTGRSIVGMEGKFVTESLYPGKTVILQKMCPHHFETDGEHLRVLPLHVYSSIGGKEFNHPMFNGTHMTDTGN